MLHFTDICEIAAGFCEYSTAQLLGNGQANKQRPRNYTGGLTLLYPNTANRKAGAEGRKHGLSLNNTAVTRSSHPMKQSP